MSGEIDVWSPLPPSASGIADYAAEQLLALQAERANLIGITPEPNSAPQALRRLVSVRGEHQARPGALALYQLGNSPAHAFVYRAALRQPGVVVLHDFSLHHLVLQETVERGERDSYLRLMRRTYRQAGLNLARQVAMGLGGRVVPALFPLCEHVLDASLAAVALSKATARRMERILGGRPVLHLPHHLELPLDPPPSRTAARAALGLPQDALIVTAPGLATASKRLDVAMAAVAGLRNRFAALRLVVAGAVEPGLPLEKWRSSTGLGVGLTVTGRLSLEDFERHLAAADVVLVLRFPSHGEMSGAVVRALGVGRPVLVSTGTPVAEEFPEGLLVPIDPGVREANSLSAHLTRLLERPELRARLGRLASAYVRREHAGDVCARRLLGFLDDVARERRALERRLAETRAPEGSLAEYLLDELRPSVRELGLAGTYLGLADAFFGLAGVRS